MSEKPKRSSVPFHFLFYSFFIVFISFPSHLYIIAQLFKKPVWEASLAATGFESTVGIWAIISICVSVPFLIGVIRQVYRSQNQ